MLSQGAAHHIPGELVHSFYNISLPLSHPAWALTLSVEALTEKGTLNEGLSPITLPVNVCMRIFLVGLSDVRRTIPNVAPEFIGLGPGMNDKETAS